MIKHYITLILVLICSDLEAQNWTFDYHDGYPAGRTSLITGFVDEDGVTFLAGRQGPDRFSPQTLLMRIEPDGTHAETIYQKDGFFSEATSILETDDHHLFVAGRSFNDQGDSLMILLYDKDLNLLRDRRFDIEIERRKIMDCRTVLDPHGNIILTTAAEQENQYGGYFDYGAFCKFNRQGELICHRCLLGEEPEPESYLTDFIVRQLWYQEEDETILCLVPGYGQIMSFITFDSAFNYLQEYPIYNDERFENTPHRDCYIDYWYNPEEALLFSSEGWEDHNHLRISRINTHGAYLDYIHFHEHPDSLDNAAWYRCMAVPNDTTFYFNSYRHTVPYLPGISIVYLLNERLELIGNYVDDQHDRFRTRLVLPTPDGGCITVNDSCDRQDQVVRTSQPRITKIKREDFTMANLSVSQDSQGQAPPYPNPTEHLLFIPLSDLDFTTGRLRVFDQRGLPVMDRIIHRTDEMLQLDVSNLKKGLYYYQIYTDDRTLLTERFIKN